MHISVYRGWVAMAIMRLPADDRLALARLLGVRVHSMWSARRHGWLIAWKIVPREAGLNPESHPIPLTREAAAELVAGLLTLTPAVTP